MAEFETFKGSWPWHWPWIGSYCILSCISRQPLRTCQMSLKSKKRFVDGRTDGRTFETHFIRSTWRSRPKKQQQYKDQACIVAAYSVRSQVVLYQQNQSGCNSANVISAMIILQWHAVKLSMFQLQILHTGPNQCHSR